jgi:hypothetical protein
VPRDEAGAAMHTEIPEKFLSSPLAPPSGILKECVRVCACVCEHVRTQHSSYVYIYIYVYVCMYVYIHTRVYVARDSMAIKKKSSIFARFLFPFFFINAVPRGSAHAHVGVPMRGCTPLSGGRQKIY